MDYPERQIITVAPLPRKINAHFQLCKPFVDAAIAFFPLVQVLDRKLPWNVKP